VADIIEKVIPLDTVLDRSTLLEAGVPYDSLYVNGAIPGGVRIKVHLGAKPGIELRDFSSLSDLCPPEREGLYITTIGTAAGQTLSLIVGKSFEAQT